MIIIIVGVVKPVPNAPPIINAIASANVTVIAKILVEAENKNLVDNISNEMTNIAEKMIKKLKHGHWERTSLEFVEDIIELE